MKTQTPALRKILTSKASVSQEQIVLMCAFLHSFFFIETHLISQLLGEAPK